MNRSNGGNHFDKHHSRNPAARFLMRKFHDSLVGLVRNAGDIPLPDQAFNLVIACELLEHLERPRSAMQELRRVSRGLCLFSVPWEPTWRILNLARGAYWRDWGNTPGHRNHWTRSGFLNFLKPHFSAVTIHPCWTWTFALCRK